MNYRRLITIGFLLLAGIISSAVPVFARCIDRSCVEIYDGDTIYPASCDALLPAQIILNNKTWPLSNKDVRNTGMKILSPGHDAFTRLGRNTTLARTIRTRTYTASYCLASTGVTTYDASARSFYACQGSYANASYCDGDTDNLTANINVTLVASCSNINKCEVTCNAPSYTKSGNACVAAVRCGDGTCNNGETCSSCVADCGACPPPPACPSECFTPFEYRKVYWNSRPDLAGCGSNGCPTSQVPMAYGFVCAPGSCSAGAPPAMFCAAPAANDCRQCDDDACQAQENIWNCPQDCSGPYTWRRISDPALANGSADRNCDGVCAIAYTRQYSICVDQHGWPVRDSKCTSSNLGNTPKSATTYLIWDSSAANTCSLSGVAVSQATWDSYVCTR